MVDETDHVTGMAGLTLTITASKNGGAFASITPTVTDRSNGWYSLALTSSHTDTIGDLGLHITATGADPSDVLFQVVSATAGLAGSNSDAATSSRMASYTQPTGFLAATFPATVASTTNITAGTITTATNVTTVNGLAAGVITAASIATGAIDADALATDAVTEIQSGLATAAALATAQADLDTITGADGVTLATAQALYAPAKAGNQMDLVNAPNATAITAIQSGLATATGVTSAFTEIKGATWSSGTDTLEHIRNAITTVGSDVLTNGGVLSLIAGAGFDTATDSLEAIRDRGDAAWITATGFSTHSAADVVTAMGTGTFLTAIPWNASWDAEVQSEAADALAAFSWSTTAVILTSAYDAAKTAASQTSVNTVDTVVDAIKLTTDKLDTALVLDGLVYQFTANALELAPTGGSAPSAADIYTYFTDSNREDAFKADVSGLSTFDHTTDQVTPTTASKTGYALASNGLDLISTIEPTGVATNFREMVIASWMVNYAKNIKDGDAGTIVVYASNGSTVVTTQTYSVVGNVETVNRAT